jgi:hypothetical protein
MDDPCWMITSEDEVVPVGLCHEEECQKLWGLSWEEAKKKHQLIDVFPLPHLDNVLYYVCSRMPNPDSATGTKYALARGQLSNERFIPDQHDFRESDLAPETGPDFRASSS